MKYSLIFALCFGVVSTVQAGMFGDLLSKAQEVTGTVNQTTNTVNGVKGILPSGQASNSSGKVLDRTGLPFFIQSSEAVEEKIIKNFDEYLLLLDRPLEAGVEVRTERLEGKFVRAQFRHAETEGGLKVWRDYQNEFKNRGYKVLFVCEKPCSERAGLWYERMKLSVDYQSDRYIVARNGNKTLAVAMGENSGRPYSVVDYIETP